MSTAPLRPQHRIRPARNWAFFLLAFALGLALVSASTLVRYNQHTPIVTATLRPGEHVDLAGWRFSIAQPLREVDVPGSSGGQGVNMFGERIDQDGAAWLYVEIDAEPLPGIDFELASCSLSLRAGDDRWEATTDVDAPAAPFCGAEEFPREVGAVRRVGSHFQIPAQRLDDEPYVVVVVPGFPARALALAGS